MRITIDIEPSPHKSTLIADLAPLASMLLGYLVGRPVGASPSDEACAPHVNGKAPTWEEALADLMRAGLTKEAAEEMLRAPGSPFASGAV